MRRDQHCSLTAVLCHPTMPLQQGGEQQSRREGTMGPHGLGAVTWHTGGPAVVCESLSTTERPVNVRFPHPTTAHFARPGNTLHGAAEYPQGGHRAGFEGKEVDKRWSLPVKGHGPISDYEEDKCGGRGAVPRSSGKGTDDILLNLQVS